MLARRILEPTLQKARAKGDEAKLRLLRVLRWLDPAGFPEQIEKTGFTRP